MELNVPALEAAEDLRQMMAIGAMFSGRDGKDYIEHLQELAWFDDPDAIESGQNMVDVAEAKISNGLTPEPTPACPPQKPSDT